MNLASWLPSWTTVHRALARLHGADISGSSNVEEAETASRDFASAYAAYADATAQANLALEKHGKNSPQFTAADIASMRLFHRVKRMQGLKKAKSN